MAEAGRIDRLIRMESGYSEARAPTGRRRNTSLLRSGAAQRERWRRSGLTESDPRDLLLPAPLTSQLDKIRAHDGIATASRAQRKKPSRRRTALMR